MWSIAIVLLFFQTLPLWLSERLSVLVLVSLLLSLIANMQSFLIANRRLQNSKQKLNEDFGVSSLAMSENCNSLKERESSPAITMRRTAALMLIGICSVACL